MDNDFAAFTILKIAFMGLLPKINCKYTTKIWYEQILEQKNKIYFIIECFLGRIWEFTHNRLPKNSQWEALAFLLLNFSY